MPDGGASRYAWVPNAITGSRFVFALILFLGAVWLTFAPVTPDRAPPLFGALMMGCYVIGAFSDLIDGWAARRLNAQTEFGARLDPMADKALAFGALNLAAAAASFAPSIVAAASLIILRDWWIDQLRSKRPTSHGLKVTSLAKIKTAILFVALGFLLAGLPPWPQVMSAASGGVMDYPVIGFLIGLVLLWVAAFLALFTGWRYVRAARLTSGGA